MSKLHSCTVKNNQGANSGAGFTKGEPETVINDNLKYQLTYPTTDQSLRVATEVSHKRICKILHVLLVMVRLAALDYSNTP